jgi:hypothetical protein
MAAKAAEKWIKPGFSTQTEDRNFPEGSNDFPVIFYVRQGLRAL